MSTMMRTLSWLMVVVALAACGRRGGGGGGDDDDDDDIGGSASCSSFCSALTRGDNCDEVDGDQCRTECGQMLEETGISRLSCAEPGEALADCLAGTPIVCEGPGQAVALADGTPAAEPEWVYVPSGTIRIEDFDCAQAAIERQECFDYGPFVDFSTEQTFEAESPEMFHGSGTQTSDGWECAECWDHIVFGPYVRTDPGAYVATFRIAADCVGGDPYAEAFRFNAATGGYNIVEDWVLCDDLTSSDWQEYTLPFFYESGSLELRVYATGALSLAVDNVRVVAD